MYQLLIAGLLFFSGGPFVLKDPPHVEVKLDSVSLMVPLPPGFVSAEKEAPFVSETMAKSLPPETQVLDVLIPIETVRTGAKPRAYVMLMAPRVEKLARISGRSFASGVISGT